MEGDALGGNCGLQGGLCGSPRRLCSKITCLSCFHPAVHSTFEHHGDTSLSDLIITLLNHNPGIASQGWFLTVAGLIEAI